MADSGEMSSASMTKDDKKAKKEKEKKKKEDKKQKKTGDQPDSVGSISSDNEDMPSASATKEDKKKQKEEEKRQKEQEKAAKKQAKKDKKQKTNGSQSGLEASADEGDAIPTTSTKKEDKKKKKEQDKAAKKAAKNETQSGNPSGFEAGDSNDNDELPSTSTTKQDKKKQKKEDKAAKKNEKKAKKNGNQSQAEAPIGAIYTDIQLEGAATNAAPASTTTAATGQAKETKKDKDKGKKNNKKTGNQPQAAAYDGMQIDDFHETPSCFSKLSNPLTKKDGYDFSSTAESIQYQEVPVTIENAPSNTKSVMEVKVHSKGDGSLPPSQKTAPPNQHVDPAFMTYTENQTYSLPETSRNVDTQALVKNSESDAKKYEDRIKKLEAENSKHEAEMKASKAQLVKLTKERDDILERKVETQGHMQNNATDVKKYEDRIKELEAKNSNHEAEMKASKAQVVKLTKERDDITERLSTEWDQKASAADESNVENINIKNRPLKLAEEYGLLCSNDWIEAKTTLDQHSTLDELDKLHLLCDIMLQAEDLATKRYEEVLKKTVQDIMQPFSYPCVGESSLSTTHSHQNEPDNPSKKAQSEETVTHILTESVALEQILQQFDVSTANEQDSDNDYGKPPQPGQGFTRYEPEKDQVDASGTDKKDKKLDKQTNHGTSAGGVDTDSSDDDTTSSNFKRKDHANSNTLSQSKGVPSNHVDLQTTISPKQKLDKLKVVLGDMMRESADYINVTKACQAINESIARKVPLKGNVRLHELQPLQMYVTSCLQFAWKMALQRPPMVFSTEGVGHPWIERSQEACHGSDNPHSLTALVVLYRSPSLLHGDRLLVKGNVLVKEQTDLK